MSDRVIDDPAARRNLLYSEKASDADLNAVADRFLERERFGEALEFLEHTRDDARLDRIRDAGVDRGDTFLVLRAEKLSGRDVPAETWLRAAANATTRGRHYDAYRATLHAGDEEAAEAIRAEHMPDYEPFRPDGK